MGVTMASFREEGNDLADRDVFTIDNRTGSVMSKFFFRSHVGNGSRPHDLLRDFMTSLATSSGLRREKSVKL